MIMILSDKDLKKNLMGTKKDTISYICQEMHVTPKCKFRVRKWKIIEDY